MSIGERPRGSAWPTLKRRYNSLPTTCPEDALGEAQHAPGRGLLSRVSALWFRLVVLRQRIWCESRGRSFSVDILRIVAAILLPPLGVFLQVGIGKHFWINILLTILGYIPGIVHAVWVIAKY